MANYVITPDVALRLAAAQQTPDAAHRLLAPTLQRSELLAELYRLVRAGRMSRETAADQLAFVRGLRLRYLGDRVLQQVAWNVADQLGWPDTYAAEYIALTKLQGDALVTLDDDLAAGAAQFGVGVAPFAALLRPD